MALAMAHARPMVAVVAARAQPTAARSVHPATPRAHATLTGVRTAVHAQPMVAAVVAHAQPTAARPATDTGVFLKAKMDHSDPSSLLCAQHETKLGGESSPRRHPLIFPSCAAVRGFQAVDFSLAGPVVCNSRHFSSPPSLAVSIQS